MDIKFLSQFKNWLQKNRKEILRKIKKLSRVPDFGSDVDSGEEEADESEEFANQLAIAQTYRERLADINSALNKIEKKKYGICEKCGKEISLDVLKAVPESKLCKECKRLS
jgi:DnaK suppressor protein